MLHRYVVLNLMALCVGLATLLAMPVCLHAQDHPSAEQLFDQGMRAYSDGDYVTAQKTFRRLDPLQLDRRQRLLMYETIQNIDRQLKQTASPDTILKNAARALHSGKLQQASKLYESIVRHPSATKSQKDSATVQIAGIKRRMNADLARARENVDQADADIRAGRYDAAERKLRAVKESGADLGWFENERIDRQLNIIAQRKQNRQAQESQPTPAVPVQPVQPAVEIPTPPQPDLDRQRQAELEQRLAQQERELAQRQQQLAQQEQAQQQLTERLEAQRKREQEQLARQQQAELERRLDAQQQQLAERERQLAEQEQAQRQLAERLEAQRKQEQEELARQQQAELERRLGEQQRQLAEREKRLAAQEQAQREMLERLEAQRQREQAQRERQLAEQRRVAQEEAARRQRQQELAQRQEAEKEKQLALARQEAQRRQAQQERSKQQETEKQQEKARLELAQRLQAQRQQELENQQRQRAAELEKQLAEKQRQLAERQQELARRQMALQQQLSQEEPQQTAPTTQPHDRALQEVAPLPKPDLLVQARHLYAQEKLAQAREAHEANQYHLAAKRYQEVLKLQPDHQEAIDALALVQSRTGHLASPQGVLETEIQARTIRGNAAIAEFQELMNRAAGLLENEAFAAARESVQQAKIALDLNQRFLPTTRYRSLRDNAINLGAQIADAERRIQEEQKREVEIARKTEAEKRRAEALLAQRQETERLLRRAADLRREQKYDQGLELINQALFLDPNNVAAQAMKEMIQDSQLYVASRNRMRQRNLMVAQQSNENLDATTPFADLMVYPPDWPQLTAARLGAADPNAAESEVNRRVALKLRDSVPVEFENNKLVNIIEYLRNTTGVNFFVNWGVLESIGIGKDLPITLQLTNVPVHQALRLVLQQASANNEQDPVAYSIIEGVVTISTERDLAKATDIRPYDIRDLLVQVPNFSDAPEFDLNSALSNTNSGGSGSSGGGGGGGSSGGPFASAEETAEELTRTELIEQVVGLIQNTVGNQEDWEVQGGQGSIRELNGNLIVKTTPKNHRDIAHLLSQLRETRALQIAVEGRFLIVDHNFLDEVGVDLDITWGDRTDENGNIINQGDVFGSDNFDHFNVGQDSVSLTDRSRSGHSNPGTFADIASRAFDFSMSYIDDIQVSLMVRATQASRRSITLTAPRLTLMNGQRAHVVVATQTAFVSDLEPIPDSNGFDPTISVTQSGVILDVEGTVSADRRYVTMTVRPSLATIVDIEQVPIGTSTITGTSDNILTQNIVNLETPILELTSVKTTVSIPDRGTLLIGGQRIVADTEIEAGVPVLSKIPVLNRLFTNTSTIKDERTLLILIKPTILIQSEEEELNFPGLLQNPQQFGIGHRL